MYYMSPSELRSQAWWRSPIPCRILILHPDKDGMSWHPDKVLGKTRLADGIREKFWRHNSSFSRLLQCLHQQLQIGNYPPK